MPPKKLGISINTGSGVGAMAKQQMAIDQATTSASSSSSALTTSASSSASASSFPTPTQSAEKKTTDTPTRKVEPTGRLSQDGGDMASKVTATGSWQHAELKIKEGLLFTSPRPSSRSSDSTPTSTSSGDPLSPGTQPLNLEPELRYRWEDLKIGKPLGGGAQASVRKCKHTLTGTHFALKSIAIDNEVTHPRAVVAEVSTLYESSCPHIISFKEAFYKDSCIHILLELMDYGSLQDLIDKYVGKKGKKLPEELLCDIATKVVKGLVYLHDMHVVHRDIKPANILLNSRGEVKLTDFGMAGKAVNTIAQLETFQGTVTYMSPERILGKSYSFESDIWALGLSMAQCALGVFPYRCIPKDQNDRTGFFELLEEITSQVRLPLSETDTSPEFREFVWACMEKDPNQRPTAKQLLGCSFLKKYEGKEFDLGKWLQKHLPRKRKEKKPGPPPGK